MQVVERDSKGLTSSVRKNLTYSLCLSILALSYIWVMLVSPAPSSSP